MQSAATFTSCQQHADLMLNCMREDTAHLSYALKPAAVAHCSEKKCCIALGLSQVLLILSSLNAPLFNIIMLFNGFNEHFLKKQNIVKKKKSIYNIK